MGQQLLQEAKKNFECEKFVYSSSQSIFSSNGSDSAQDLWEEMNKT